MRVSGFTHTSPQSSLLLRIESLFYLLLFFDPGLGCVPRAYPCVFLYCSGKKNRLRQEESSSRGDSETASVVSDISDGWLNNEETSLEDIIKDLMEKLAEKRLSTRVSAIVYHNTLIATSNNLFHWQLGALQKLVKFLQTKYAPHALGGRMFTLTSSLSNCLRSKSAKEASMACHVIGLLTLTADSDDSQLYDEFHKTLRAFSADHTKAPSLRAHAIRTLVFLSFLTVDDPSAFTELQKLAQVFKCNILMLIDICL